MSKYAWIDGPPAPDEGSKFSSRKLATILTPEDNPSSIPSSSGQHPDGLELWRKKHQQRTRVSTQTALIGRS